MFWIIGSMVESLMFFIAFMHISKLQFSKIEALLIILFNTIALVAIVNFIHLLYIPPIVVVIVANAMWISIISAAAYVKTRNIPVNTMYAFFSSIVVLFAGHVSRAPLNFILDLIGEPRLRGVVLNDWVLYMLYVVIAFVISFTISRLWGIFLHKKIQAFDDEWKRRVASYMIVGASVVLSLFLIITYLQETIINPAAIITIYAILLSISFSLFVFAIFSIENLHQEREIKYKNEQLQNLQIYTDNVEKMVSEVKKFRHDHSNLMLGFQEYIDNNDIENIRKYFMKYMTLFAESTSAANAQLNNLALLKVSEIRSILSYKTLYALQKNIDVFIEVPDIVEDIGTDNLIDLCRIISILIDNAIESCCETKQPVLRFLALKREADILFVITNTCPSPPSLSQIFEKGYSTKKGQTGLGLYTVAQLVSNNNNLSLNTCIDNGDFVQELSVRI